jgi:hypothetical protein
MLGEDEGLGFIGRADWLLFAMRYAGMSWEAVMKFGTAHDYNGNSFGSLERMQGKRGLGGIFPAMANAVMALKTLGYSEDHPDFSRGVKALEDLLVRQGDEGSCQVCVSPVWDSCLPLSALLEEGVPPDHEASPLRWSGFLSSKSSCTGIGDRRSLISYGRVSFSTTANAGSSLCSGPRTGKSARNYLCPERAKP